jgi:hypothetical protein
MEKALCPLCSQMDCEVERLEVSWKDETRFRCSSCGTYDASNIWRENRPVIARGGSIRGFSRA